MIKPFLAGRDVKRYAPLEEKQFLIFFEKGVSNQKGAGYRSKWSWVENEYPAVAAYLKPFQKEAEKRYDKGDYWWELRACDYYHEFEKPKIMYLVFQVKPAFTYDRDGNFFSNNATYIIPLEDLYFLGILNSKLGWLLISNNCTRIQGGYQLIYKYFEKTPIRTTDFSDPADVARHDRMVTLVEQMLDLNRRLQAAKAPHEREVLAGMIDATDRQIDRLVYELYGLTEDEVAIVEGAL